MFDEPTQNKMMTAPPVKKEYHFAATTEHYAAVILAATIQEAEALYHKVKRPLTAPALSTPAPATEKEAVE